MQSSFSRDVVTPATAVLFIVSTVTGVMLLLHWNGGIVHAAHEWLSLVFSALAIWHLARNWRAFTLYLRRRPALTAMAAAAIVSVIFTGLTARENRSRPPQVAPVASAQP